MIWVATSFLIAVIICVLTLALLSRTPHRETTGDIYKCSRALVVVAGVCWVGWVVLTAVFLLAFWGKPAEVRHIWSMAAFVALMVVTFARYVFLSRTRVTIADGVLIKRTPLWTTAVAFTDVRKIIIYTARSESAKMTRLCAKKSTTLEGWLAGYDELVEKVVANCPNAEVTIRKPISWHGLKRGYQALVAGVSILLFLLSIPALIYVAFRLISILETDPDLPLIISQNTRLLLALCFLAVILALTLLCLLCHLIATLAIGLSLYAAGQIGLRDMSGLLFHRNYPKHWYIDDGDTEPVTQPGK